MSERIRTRAIRAAPLVVLLVGACGSSDNASSDVGSSQFRSRVDESKALGTLTPDEQVTLCADVASWIATLTKDPAYIEGSCTLSGISQASSAASSQHLSVDQMRQACSAAENTCKTQQGMGPLPSSRGCAYPASCTATVGDVKNCTVGTYQGNMKLYATLPSCDAMQPDTTSKIDYSLETGAAAVCSKVNACGLPT